MHIISTVLLLPLSNVALFLWDGIKISFCDDFYLVAKQLLICITTVIAEELFFRGLVLRELVFSYRWQSIRASLIVSLAFGVLHMLNVNSYATWSYAIVQSICAFAVSFNLCAIFVKTKSLLCCVLIHGLINITSIGLQCCFNGQLLLLSYFESIIFLSVSFIYLVNGIKVLNSEMVEGK